MNISDETLTMLNMYYSYSLTDDNINDVNKESATRLNIGFSRIDSNYIGKTIRELKKEITLDYIMNKINTDRIYKSFAEHFNELLKKSGLNYSAYPTTYGIGVFVAISYRDNITKTKQQIEKMLTDAGIKYLTEYSDAGWVFRYKISKEQNNIKTIEKIINQ